MTLTADVFARITTFVKGLSDDELAELASGAAKLELVPRGGRPIKAAASALTRPAAEIEATLVELGSRQAAKQYLVDQKLTVAQLKALAGEFGVPLASKATKPVAIDAIVEWAVGRNLDSAAITRLANA